MKFDIEDFKEQAEFMNMLNIYNTNNKINNSATSIGFNDDTLYNFIEQQNNKYKK